MTKNKKRKSI